MSLGAARLLEEEDIGHTVTHLFEHRRGRQNHGPPPVGDVEAHHPLHPLRVHDRRAPHHETAPVVTDEHSLIQFESVQHTDQIAD